MQEVLSNHLYVPSKKPCVCMTGPNHTNTFLNKQWPVFLKFSLKLWVLKNRIPAVYSQLCHYWEESSAACKDECLNPQVRLIQSSLFRGKPKRYNNLFGMFRPTLWQPLLGPPLLTSLAGLSDVEKCSAAKSTSTTGGSGTDRDWSSVQVGMRSGWRGSRLAPDQSKQGLR